MRGQRALLLIILLLALSLRLFRLDGQSLWADEGVSVALAFRDLPTIARSAAQDIHPPLYYYLLYVWVHLWGGSEMAVRSLSVFCGVALVAATYLLGQALFGPRVALCAAFLSALSPFQIYYSQETRMYILVALWGALSLYSSLRFMRGGEKAYMVAYIAATTLALYTHYFAFTIVLVANAAYFLGLLLNLSPRRRRHILLWCLSQIAVALLYLPWLLFAGGQLRTWPAISEPLSLPFLLRETLRIFSLGLSLEPGLILLGFFGLLILGMVPTRRSREEGYSLAFTVFYFLLPPLIMYLLSLSRPLYRPKLLLLATPGFYLLLARGASGEWIDKARWPAIRHLVTSFSLLFVTIISLLSLRGYFFDPRYARDDYRGLARYISAMGAPGDAILLNAPGQIDVFSYYYKGALSIYPLPGERPPDEEETIQALEGIAARYRRLYGVFWATAESDPQGLIEGWLDRYAFEAFDRWYGNVRLVLYALPQETVGEEIENPRELTLGEGIRFLGYSMPRKEVEAGDILPLTLFWETSKELGERYKVFIHALDGQEHIVGQRDGEPVGGSKATTTWRAGEVIADRHGLLILPGTPPGEYEVEVGLYSLSTGERLPAKEGNEPPDSRFFLPPIQVVKPNFPPPLDLLEMQHRVGQGYGPLALLGYNLSKLGFEHDPWAPLRLGEALHLTLFWQARERPQEEVQLTIRLVNPQGQEAARWTASPTGGEYPLTSWEPQEVVRDQHHLILPSELSPGQYRLLLEVEGVEPAPSPLFLQIVTIK